MRAEASRTGKAVYYKNGLDIKPTDPAVLQELMDGVKAKKQSPPQRLIKLELMSTVAIQAPPITVQQIRTL